MARLGARTALVVRGATPDDLPILLALYAEFDLGRSPRLRRSPGAGGGRSVVSIEDSFRSLIDAPDHRVLLVASGAEPVGLAVLSVGPVSPLVPDPVVRVGPLVVATRARRRGAGGALLAAAANFAEERGVQSVSVVVPPADREGNRYFARLGFAPMEIRRTATVSVLRRRLGAPGTGEVGSAALTSAPAILRRRLRTRAMQSVRPAAPAATEVSTASTAGTVPTARNASRD